MKSSSLPALALTCALLVLPCSAQVNSGSNGSDGAFNPTQDVTIDMSDHPDGIYQYTSVNIPSGVTVTFKPNANNTPVVWLLQSDCVINGSVILDATGGLGGPGGYRGGNGGNGTAGVGLGPGGGMAGDWGGNASFGDLGSMGGIQAIAGSIYGNNLLMPLVGGSGGGGSPTGGSGAGGGGAILIATSKTLTLDGIISAHGGRGFLFDWWTSDYGFGAGSGGAVRLVGTTLKGGGLIDVSGGGMTDGIYSFGNAGHGRVRFDVFENTFVGQIIGPVTSGFQPIIIPAAGQGMQLSIASVGGVQVANNPTGLLANPDVIVPAQQTNSVPIVVKCTNLPLDTQITVVAHPVNGADVAAIGVNNVGNLASSTATFSLNMPRGGGIIYAKCVSGIAGLGANTSSNELRGKSLATTGWTADGERFAKMEVRAALGGKQQIAYITESGKRYAMP